MVVLSGMAFAGLMLPVCMLCIKLVVVRPGASICIGTYTR